MVEVRPAEDEIDALLVHRALMHMHAEGGIPGGVDPDRTLAGIVTFMQGPGSVVWMAMRGDELAGVLIVIEEGAWFGPEEDRFLIDKGFYVLPAHRGGDVGKALLDEAIALSNATGLSLFITIFNANRPRGPRSQWERLGMTMGYHPMGAVLAHIPKET